MQSDNSLLQKLYHQSGLSHSQIQIWAGQKVHPESPFCNMAFAFTIEGCLDVSIFSLAWQQVVDSNDVLRTYIREANGSPSREIHAKGSCSMQLHDLSEQRDPVQRFTDICRTRCATLLLLDGELVESSLFKLADDCYGWFLNQHHLITDATATTVTYEAVVNAYLNLIDGNSAEPSTEPGYYDIVCSKDQSKVDESSKVHWESKKLIPRGIARLYGARSDQRTTESERIQIELSIEESKSIRALCSEPEYASFFQEVSLFNIFATLMTSYLFRASEQSEVSFDIPAGNRSTSSSRKVMGCFIEMFPYDLKVDSTETFRTLAVKCMGETRQFLSNVAPGASSPDGATSSNAVLNFFPKSFCQFSDFKVNAQWIHSKHIDGVYDFKLQVHDYNNTGRYTIQFDLSDSTFSELTKTRVPTHFKCILNSMLLSLDTEISELDLITDEEKHSIITHYNSPSAYPIPENSLVEIIAKQVAANPNSTVLRERSSKLTYSELWNRIEPLAKAIRAESQGENKAVIVAMNRSMDAVIAILATLRAGAAFIPIDPKYPKERIDRIVNNSQAVLAIVDSQFKKSISRDGIKSLNLLELSELGSNTTDSSLPYPNIGDLAYVIYTSGSTGTPKGVEIEHRGLADYIDWATRSYVRGDKLSFPLFTSLSFDLTITSLFLPLVTGGELIVYESSSSEVDSAVIDVVNENVVDFIKLTPSHLALLRQLDLSKSKISRIVVGGEDLKRSLASAVSGQFGDEVEIFNEYGPTETVVGCMIHRFEKQDKDTYESVPIGKPADHVQLYLLNDSLKPTPEGTPGELCIARNGIARGYRYDPEKTRKSFIPNPFQPGGIVYRTGDLVRFSSPGVLTFLGRIDNQVKVNGHRLELGEVEAALLQCEGIENAFVRTSQIGNSLSSNKTIAHCKSCGLSSHYPNIVFDQSGVCSICSEFKSIVDEATSYFESQNELRKIFDDSRREKSPKYDCMVFYSGGKDSSYALGNLVDMGLKVYAFTLDNGYLSDQAMGNISRVVERLGVDHEFAKTDAMNEIFRDSLTRFSNVCNGCFKTIYTLGVNRAHELRIPIIVTGLSRGQFFETRLTQNLFQNNRFSPCQVDTAVLEARKAYHRVDDAVSRNLDTSLFSTDEIFNEIKFVDFYRYWDASLDDLYEYLEKRLPWIRPSDTGRSTNCLVNDVGIYIHKKERGYHNYELPYSWDVRMGHKKRDEALEELDDKYEVSNVKRMLNEIGYDEDRLSRESERKQIVAYYVSRVQLPISELDLALSKLLPAQLRPSHYIQVEHMPLTSNGKVDSKALPLPALSKRESDKKIVAPSGPVEEHVFEVWSKTFRTREISTHDSFFQLGGTSLDAMEMTLQLCNDFEIDLPLQSIFKNPTIASLSTAVETKIIADVEALSEEEANQIVGFDSNP